MSQKNHLFYKIDSNRKLKLSKIPPLSKLIYHSSDDYKKILEESHATLSEYQTLLYAEHRKSLLIIFQGMDSAGKDGAIKHVMSGINPQGCSVASFKTPSKNELDHDFLWRSQKRLPAKGEIGIFNRSYYEEVLVTKVHPNLLKFENLPTKKNNFWQKRYSDIVHFENYLHRQNFEIIKIFLHIDKAEQKARLLSRFDDPKKFWKIEEADLIERIFWSKYQEAYNECISMTSTKHFPWYVVPANDKKNARLAISKILIERFKEMKLAYPRMTPEKVKILKKLSVQLKRS